MLAVEARADQIEVAERVLLVRERLILQHLTADIVALASVVQQRVLVLEPAGAFPRDRRPSVGGLVGRGIGALLAQAVAAAMRVDIVGAASLVLGACDFVLGARACPVLGIDIAAVEELLLLLSDVVHRQVELVRLDHLMSALDASARTGDLRLGLSVRRYAESVAADRGCAGHYESICLVL